MTHRFDMAHRPELVARWCALAEQRLEYLTELFKTGRWRRYYSDVAFLENIQEAKAMVAHWRDLSRHQALGESTGLAVLEVTPGAAPIVVAPAREMRVAATLAELARPSEAPSAAVPEPLENLPAGVELVQDRYSLLRNLVL